MRQNAASWEALLGTLIQHAAHVFARIRDKTILLSLIPSYLQRCRIHKVHSLLVVRSGAMPCLYVYAGLQEVRGGSTMECSSTESPVTNELARDVVTVERLSTHQGPRYRGPAVAGAQGANGHVLGTPLLQEAPQYW